MKFISSLLLCVLAFANVALCAVPGKVAFWDSSVSSQQLNRIRHTTKSVSPENAVSVPAKLNKKYEAVVYLQSDGLLSQQSVANSIKASSGAEVLTNVHKSDSTSLRRALIETPHMKNAKAVSVEELTKLIKESDFLNDGKADAFVVKVEKNMDALKDLFTASSTLASGKLLFIASTESTAEAPTQMGNYKRHLSAETADAVGTTLSSVTTTFTTAAVPATGAEFSIYYEGTYLYITPDIFTGLMTFLFMFFVVLIGLNCMGSIQGMSSFYDRVPSNGKEA